MTHENNIVHLDDIFVGRKTVPRANHPEQCDDCLNWLIADIPPDEKPAHEISFVGPAANFVGLGDNAILRRLQRG